MHEQQQDKSIESRSAEPNDESNSPAIAAVDFSQSILVLRQGFCKFSRADIVAYIQSYATDSKIELSYRFTQGLWRHSGSRRFRQYSESPTLSDNHADIFSITEITATSLSDFESQLSIHKVTILDNLRISIKNNRQNAVLSFSRERPLVLLTVRNLNPVHEYNYNWSLPSVRSAERRSTLGRGGRTAASILLAIVMAILAYIAVATNPNYSSWQRYLEAWRQLNRFSQSGAQVPAHGTLFELIDAPLFALISLATLVRARLRLRKMAHSRLILVRTPWQSKLISYRDNLQSAIKASGWSLRDPKVRVTGALVGVVSITVILLGLVLGLVAVTAFLAWLAIVVAIFAWLWPRKPS